MHFSRQLAQFSCPPTRYDAQLARVCVCTVFNLYFLLYSSLSSPDLHYLLNNSQWTDVPIFRPIENSNKQIEKKKKKFFLCAASSWCFRRCYSVRLEETRRRNKYSLSQKPETLKVMIYWIELESMPLLLLTSTISAAEPFNQMSYLSRQTTTQRFDAIVTSNYCLPSSHRLYFCYYFVSPFTFIDWLSTGSSSPSLILTAMTATATFVRRGQCHYAYYRYVPLC